MRKFFLGAAMTLSLGTVAQAAADAAGVVNHYADLAQAKYEDALLSATALQAAIGKLTADPSEQTLAAARDAWITARVPYQQTEAFRFGNPIVDAWEGGVNAWPLDEGLIDYVDGSYGVQSEFNDYYAVNIIANKTIDVAGKEVDATEINPDLLRNVLHEAGGNEANVATGYHAIEFLLWGQDLNGVGPAPAGRTGSPHARHAGNRPHTDFDVAQCTGGHCDRRTAYLNAAIQLLVSDLQAMSNHWKPGGDARMAISGTPEQGLVAMLTGLGSLSYGELAGERIKLGLMLHDPEEEHDCFSDNTHNSHYFNQVGMMNVYTGRYQRVDGSEVKGPSLSELIRKRDASVDSEVRARMNATLEAMQRMRDRAEQIESYDQMIAQGNKEGNAVIQTVIDALIAQTRGIERAIALLDLNSVRIEGSDSLDQPTAVFQ